MGPLKDSIKNLREEYDKDKLTEDNLPGNPVELFEKWLNLAFSKGVPEPIALNLATVNSQGRPSSRVVLLRGFDENGFIFYTNYKSSKGNDLAINPYAAMCFYWYDLNKQVRIEGPVSKVTDEVSDEYFNSRPRESQLGAWVSNQSEVIKSRQEFEVKLAALNSRYAESVPRPSHWGGYILKPDKMEFWQGRASRLHDRIQYIFHNNSWEISRLAP